MARPEDYENWDIQQKQLWELQGIANRMETQNKELGKIVTRLGILVFFFIVIPLVVGFCSVVLGSGF